MPCSLQLADISNLLFSVGPELSCDPKGVFAILKSLDALSLKSCGTGLRNHTRRLVERLCMAFVQPEAAQHLHTAMGQPLNLQVRLEYSWDRMAGYARMRLRSFRG